MVKRIHILGASGSGTTIYVQQLGFTTRYVYTLANAGKVKRIRRNPRIRIAPCTMRGKVIGPWVEAEATIVDATTAAHGHALLRQKYGWMKGIGDLVSHLLHRERVVITIRVLA